MSKSTQSPSYRGAYQIDSRGKIRSTGHKIDFGHAGRRMPDFPAPDKKLKQH